MKDRPWFEFWPEGVPKHIDYPEAPLFQFLTDTGGRYPNKPALLYRERKISFGELETLSDGFAGTLIDLKVKPGDRVMLFLPNLPEYVIGYYGILKSDAIVTAASPLFKERELEYQLEDSGAETVITRNSLRPVVERITGRARPENVIVVEEGAADIPCGQSENLIFQRKKDMDPRKDIAVLQYTGGTTGIQKGAMMTHYNLAVNAIQNAKWFGWTSDDVVLAVLPFCHTWSTCVCINSPVLVGATVVLLDHFDPAEVLETIEREKVTICYGSATMVISLPRVGGLHHRYEWKQAV